MSKIMIVMAAGLGSRYGGDKQIAGVGPSNEILLEYSVYDAIKAGFNKIILIIKSGLEDILDPILEGMKSAYPDIEFCYAYQDATKPFEGVIISPKRTKPLGTVHAVLSAIELIDSDFGVINADDFYGRGAYESLVRAMDKFDDNVNAALITYSLDKTLSKNGAVTRGICNTKDGMLCGIHEAYKVKEADDGVIYETTDNGLSSLAPETAVSMNMWGFSIKTLPTMVEYLKNFLSNLDEEDNRSECILPIMAGDMLSSGDLCICVLPTDEKWFGITYREDLNESADELKKRHQCGQYPNKLF